MNRRFGPFLIVMGFLCGTCAWAQSDAGASDATAPTQPGPKPAFTYPDSKPSMDFLSGSLENSSITLGVGTGFTYDSSVYRTANSSQGRWLFQVTPNVAIQQFRPKLAWNLSYAGGFQTYTNPGNISTGNTNLFAQNANGGFLWQMAPRWQLQGNDHFAYTADPFGSSTAPGLPSGNNPNPVPNSNVTQYKINSAVLALTNQLTKVDSLAFVGTESLRNTSTYNLVTSVPFYNLISYGGRANYNHRATSRLTVGGGYAYNSLDFGHGVQRSGIQTIEATVDYVLRPNMSISGWVGPEHTSTKSIVPIPLPGQIFYVTVYDSLWSIAVGANFTWRGRRDVFQAGFSRQVNDGGGVIATAQVLQVTASYRRQLMPKLDLLANMAYFNNTSTTITSRTYNSIYGTVGANYLVTRSVNVNANYYYVSQIQSNNLVIGYGNYNDNRFSLSVNYSWTHPLGR